MGRLVIYRTLYVASVMLTWTGCSGGADAARRVSDPAKSPEDSSDPGQTREDGRVGRDAGCLTCANAGSGSRDAARAETEPRDAGALSDRDAAPGPGVDAGVGLPARDAGVGPNGRPLGVALCYSPGSDAHAATAQFWDVLRRGDLSAREASINALKAAASAAPNEEEFALLLGLASLWRVAEPAPLESLNLLLTLDSITTAQSSLEEAYRLCPSDYRIPAWLGPIKIRMGRMMDDAALVEAGFAVLNEGVAHYPGFVLFSRFLVYADLPATDPDFMKAVEAVRDNAVYCGTLETGLASDPACNNHPRASHNTEGASLFLGDMYAKAQDRAAALAAYESAKRTDTWSTWDYQLLLEERITTLDKRIEAAASAATTDDLESAWMSQIQCSLCHRD